MLSKRPRPVHAVLGFDAKVKEVLALAKANGCKTRLNRADGTAEAKDGDVVVFRALQKGCGGPWICAYYNSDRITWTKPELPNETGHESTEATEG